MLQGVPRTAVAFLVEQTAAPRVLVADDEEDIRALVTLAVRRAGCTVAVSAADGAEALRAARAEVPRLAVLDVSMPGSTGLEVCGALRAGADAYLAKPFGIAALVARVRELVQ